MVGDLTGVGALSGAHFKSFTPVTMPSHATDEDFSHTPVQEPTASKAGLFVHERTEFLVTEVVSWRSLAYAASHLFNESLRDQLFQGSHCFFLAATTGF